MFDYRTCCRNADSNSVCNTKEKCSLNISLVAYKSSSQLVEVAVCWLAVQQTNVWPSAGVTQLADFVRDHKNQSHFSYQCFLL